MAVAGVAGGWLTGGAGTGWLSPQPAPASYLAEVIFLSTLARSKTDADAFRILFFSFTCSWRPERRVSF